MNNLIHQYIDGAWTETADGSVTALVNPATGEVTGSIEQGTDSDVDRAVAAARRALRSYSRSSLEERADLLRAVAAEYERRNEDMAIAVTTDIGMSLANSRVAVGAAIFQFSTLADVLADCPFEEATGTHRVRKEPIGVCGLIPPWNYPAMQWPRKSRPHWQQAARSCSNRPSSPRTPARCSPRSCTPPASPEACSTWSSAAAR